MATETGEQEKLEELKVPVSQAMKHTIERAADVARQSVTDFVRTAALQLAEATLEDNDRIVLSERDCVAFVELLERDSEPAPALVEAVRRYRAECVSQEVLKFER